MSDRRFIQNLDWGLLLLVCLLTAVGLLTLYSAVTAGGTKYEKVLYYRQIIWYLVGYILIGILFFLDYKFFERWAVWIYYFSIVLLICVLLMGKHVAGSTRWLALGPVSIQPSEFAKIGVIIILAKYYARHIHVQGLNFQELIKPAILVGIPFILIIKQPDLGTGLIVVFIAGVMTLFVKVEKQTLKRMILVCLIIIPITWKWFLKGYQKQRILTFLNPDGDPLNTGYHIIQSKIAIGSGMIFGKGFLKGSQNALSFLPEQHTDFIFSVLAEEWGFVGSMTMIVLFLLLILWGLNISWQCREPFGKILAFGVTAMIFWQVIINIAMVMGLMPVVGVPLPLVSYGGSSVISIMVCIGILMSVSSRRFMFE